MALNSVVALLTSSLSLPALGLGLLVAWYVGSTLYYWQRLRHVPGPWLASFSYLWLARVSTSGQTYAKYLELAKRYGPVVRIGPNEVLTSDVDAFRRMSAPQGRWPKAAWVNGGRVNPYTPTLFMERDPRAHDAYKARLAPAYSGREVPALEAAVDGQVRALLRLLRRRYAGDDEAGGGGVPCPLVDVVGFFTLDVVARVALGAPFGCLAAGADVVGLYRTVSDMLPFVNFCTDVPWARALVYSPLFLRLFGPRETDALGLGRILKFTNDFVRSRFANKEDPTQDVLGSFMRHGLTQAQCETETLFMFVAGSDTTASVLRMTLFQVVACPRVYGRLKAEIAAAVASGRAPAPAAAAARDDDDDDDEGAVISLVEARALPYLQAVVYEGLRARPVTTGQQAKEVPAGGDAIRGRALPAGTSVGLNYGALFRDPDLFGPDPDVFRPERFLPSAAAGAGGARDPAALRRDVELAFGYGRYMCAGKPIALLELNKVLFELIRHFDWQLLDPTNPVQSQDYNLFRDSGMRMRVTVAARLLPAA